MGNLRRHHSTTRTLIGVLGIVAAGVVPLVPGGTAAAASLTAADTTELRAAITILNGSPDTFADTITLTTAGPYLLSCGTNEDANADGDLDYASDDDLTITYAGVGRATIAVDQTGGGCTTERVIDHRGAGTLRLEHLVVADGDLTNSGGIAPDGGGIRIPSGPATLVLDDVVVENNRAGDGVGGGGGLVPGGDGGGIYAAAGDVEITDSIIRGNTAGDGAARTATTSAGTGGDGGGIASIDANVTLTDTIVEANAAGRGGAGSVDGWPVRGGTGGGIVVFNSADLTITRGRIGGTDPASGNRAGDGGDVGGYLGATQAGSGGFGGGITGPFGGTITITGTEIAYNRAGEGTTNADFKAGPGGAGGGISTSGVIVLNGALVHDNQAGQGGASTSDDGGSGGAGGGLYVFGSSADLTAVDTEIVSNDAGTGGASVDGFGGPGGLGGGALYAGGSVVVTDSLVESNRAGAGGASTNTFGGSGGSGGGLRTGNFTTTQPVVVITDSIVRGNEAGASGAGSVSGQPGNGAGLQLSGGTAEIAASTVNDNTGARFGGAIYNSGADTTIENTTIDANGATTSGGGMYVSSGDVSILSTTLSDNTATFGSTITILNGSTTLERSAIAGPVGNHCSNNVASVTDGGDNVEQSPGLGTCNITPVVANIALGALQDNGGPTPTRLPDATLIDQIAPGDCVETADQRGRTRPLGTGCDIGAVEFEIFITAVADDATGIAAQLVVDVLDNDLVADVPLDPASVTVSNGPTNGSTDVNPATGEVTYTPTGAFSGIDQFTYRVCLVGLPLDCGAAVVDIDITQPDNVPDVFAFVDVDDVPPSTEQTSNTITIAGINVTAPVSVTGGAYSVNGGAFTGAAGTVAAGDTVRVRHTSATDPMTETNTTLTVGGVGDTFTSTTAEPIAPAGATRFVPLAPERLFDTRDGTGLTGVGKIAAGGTVDVQVTGRLNIPDDAVAVVINLTVTAPEAPGFVTAFPRGGSVPTASTLNVTGPGQTRPNLATVPLDDDGYMSAFALMTTHLLGDVAGYYVGTDVGVADGRLVPLPPTRIFDTRPAQPANGPKGFVPAEGSITVQISGEAGVPDTGVSAVVLNVTATQSAGPNFITVWPTGQPRSDASALNLFGGETTANLVIVPLGDGGQIDLYTLAGAHLIADVTAYFTDATAPVETDGLFVPLDPARLFDTRPSQPAPGPKGYVGAGTSITAQITGAGGVPGDAAAVALNVTATQAPTGFITAWPTGDPLPTASTLNPQGASDTRPNAAILPVGNGGQIDFYALSGAHLIADTTGYYTG